MIPARKFERSSGRQWGVLVLVILIGINLRPFLAAPGPLLADIVRDTGMSHDSISLLTLLPMLFMGIGAFVSPRLQAVIGTRRGLLVAITILALGSALRLLAYDGAILIMSAAVCGAGVAFIQAAFPGIIKANFPGATAVVTGLYSAMIMGGGAIGARVMPELVGRGYSWREALAWLSVPAFAALVAAWMTLTDARVARPDKAMVGHLLRRPRSWALMAAFGLVNGGYSSIITWLAPYYQGLGWESADSANLVAVMAICQAIAALGLPLLAQHGIDRRPWLLLALAMQATGFAGLAFAPTAEPAFWAGICGAGLGGSFSLAIVTALDHLPRPEQAGALAALMQGGGFLLAAIAPFLLALLHNWSGGFAAGWTMHVIFVAATAILYMGFDPRFYAEATRIGELPSA